MTISFEKNDAESRLTANINGSIDTITSDAFEEQLNAVLKGIKQLILNFTDVDYITSSGLRAVFVLNKQMTIQGTMCLMHLNPEVREIFKITGFDKFLDIRD